MATHGTGSRGARIGCVCACGGSSNHTASRRHDRRRTSRRTDAGGFGRIDLATGNATTSRRPDRCCAGRCATASGFAIDNHAAGQ